MGSIDLQSQTSNEPNFEQFIKNREKREKEMAKSEFKRAQTVEPDRYKESDAKSQYVPIHEPKMSQSMAKVGIQPRDATLDSQVELAYNSQIEPSISMKTKKTGKSRKSGATSKPVAIQKPTAIDLPAILDPEAVAKMTPVDETEYKSRNAKSFDDDKSICSADPDDEENDDNLNKQSAAFLNKQKTKLEKEMLRNEQMMEVEKNKVALGAKSDQDIKPNKRFKNFNDVFSGLTRSKNVMTQDPIIYCMITYNSVSAITVTKKNDREHNVHQFNLETFMPTFEEKFGGIDDVSYIKMNEVQQNQWGTYFAAPYLDDGRFYLRTFGTKERTQQEIEENELDINAALGLNNHTMPINNFPDPFITCCFVTDDLIFVNLFHNKDIQHHHFFWTISTRKMSQHMVVNIQSSPKNFPVEAFYNVEYNEIYTFYRQGQSFRIPVFDIECKQNFEIDDKLKNPCTFQDIFDKDLGQMFLINDTALVARSSSQILFFKLELDEFTGQREWQLYHTIEEGGNIFFIKGNKRIQVVTEEKIFFYLIDLETYEVALENVMNNFMNCSIMMFGAKVKYGITFKTNEKSFDVYRRKYVHDFKVNTVAEDMDGSRGLPIESMDAFLVSQIDKINFYDINTFKLIKQCEIQVQLLPSTTREKNEIISMQISPCENFLAVVTGKKLIMDQNKCNQIFVYKRMKNLNAQADTADKFEEIRRIRIAENPEFDFISMQFMFKNTKYGRDPDTLIFARQQKIIQLNFITNQTDDLAVFDTPLTRQPDFFLLSDDQSIAIIASSEDGIYFNMANGAWVDLDETYDIGSIKEIVHDDESRQFYMLANKHQGKMGVFLIKFHEQNPKSFEFFLKYKTKLDIADADIAIMRNKKNQLKELIVSYKTILSNCYNVYIVDISKERPWPLFRHESFQLWESQITAFFLKSTSDYVTINKDGISLISLDCFDKRYIKSADGQEKMIHSIESVNYLKVDKDNFIYFDFSGEKKIVNVVQQFQRESKAGPETAYEDIYKLRVHVITLRELLLFQSLYVCSTQTEILKLVKSQLHPEVFFKTFLELDGTNMVTILSFDSRSMKVLLGEENAEHFEPQYPLFYKNKIQKSDNKERFFYRSAVDLAIKTNQLSAVAQIINYVVNYQNSFVSSYLFKNNCIDLMEKGVNLSDLFNSQVFNYTFDYDQWPSTHTVREMYMRPYNGSIFEIRDKYRDIFFEDKFSVPDENLAQEVDSSKIYKISYKVNILSQINEYIEQPDPTQKKVFFNKRISLMQNCCESDELELFNSEAIKNILDFKWQEYARGFHLIGCTMHFGYMFLLFFYISQVYVNNSTNDYDFNLKLILDLILCGGLVYPMLYEVYQIKRYGFKVYMTDLGNINDQLYVWCGIINLFSQQVSEFDAFHNKCIITIILMQQILKSFFYLRIFATLSYIVTMIFQVVADLRAFLIFFFILVFLFSLIFAVIGAGNENQPGSFQDLVNEGVFDDPDFDGDTPNEDYQSIGIFFGAIMSTLRTAIGDFDFTAAYYLTKSENWMYFIIWFMVVVITCIIFLNFIIAEASASYAQVMENIDALKNKEKASLVFEAEKMMSDKWKKPSLFPKFIIIRKEDN